MIKSKFDSILSNISENYLTANMGSSGGSSNGSVQMKHSGGSTTAPQKSVNNLKKSNINNNSDKFFDILNRASTSNDGLDGIDDFETYLDEIGVDRTKIIPFFNEFQKRLNAQSKI